VDDDLTRLYERQMDAATHACQVFMEHVIGEAQRGAPIDEGTLRATGNVTVQRTPNGCEVIGSFSTPYAAVQHEHTEFVHPKGGHAKYLEAPFKANINRLAPLLAAAIERTT
jgi:hypothetical protein